MKLQIDFNDHNYRSDSISNGRIVKNFFKRLSRGVFANAYRYALEHHKITGEPENPLLFAERNLYSQFAASINQITRIHLSEWGFGKNDSETLANNRRIDFWCIYKRLINSKPVNFYIELKKGWYSLNKTSKVSINAQLMGTINKLTDQLRDLRKLKPKFNDIDDVYLGVLIVHGYFRAEEHYTSEDLHNEFYNVIDKRTIRNHLISTWVLADDMPIQWEKSKCSFITIIGIPLGP